MTTTSAERPPRSYLTARGRAMILKRDQWRCQICFVPFAQLTAGRYLFNVDHGRALCNGGTNDVEWLRCVCSNCHSLKTVMDVNTAQWETLTGASKYFSGPLARTPTELQRYYQELHRLQRRLCVAPPAQHAELAESARPAQLAQLVESAQLSEPTQPTQSAPSPAPTQKKDGAGPTSQADAVETTPTV